MAEGPQPPDPALERLARAVEMGTFRALVRFAAFLVVLYLLLFGMIIGLAPTLAGGGSTWIPFSLAAVALIAIVAVVAVRFLRPRI